MGSHVDTPEWQSFERRMRERYLARRRHRRLRWAFVIAAAVVIGVSVAPPGVRRQSTTAFHRVENPQARVVPLLRPDSTVTVLRFPFAPTIIAEPATVAAAEPAALAATEVASDSPAPPARSAELNLPASGPEAEPRPEPKPEPERAPPPPPPSVTSPPPELPRAEPVAPLVETLPESRPPAPVGTTATTPAATAVNVEHDVRSVIDRYRAAYERLDAAAARAVWPGVDEAALSRAFDGLTSQRIEFDRCDIWRDAQAAFASCSGTASYVPKVGRAQNDVRRSWHFRFRRRTAGWTIESAEVR
jgi:hypothetical protein